MSAESVEEFEVPACVEDIKGEPEKALRAPKELSDGNPPGVEGARTAARYIGEQDGVPMFEVVTTKLRGFPEGKDMVDEHTQVSVANWVRAQDPDIIDVADEEGFSA